MTAVMLAAEEAKPKMVFRLLAYDAAVNIQGTTGSLIHMVVTPTIKVRNEIRYLQWLRYNQMPLMCLISFNENFVFPLPRVLSLMLARGEDVDRRNLQQ